MRCGAWDEGEISSSGVWWRRRALTWPGPWGQCKELDVHEGFGREGPGMMRDGREPQGEGMEEGDSGKQVRTAGLVWVEGLDLTFKLPNCRVDGLSDQEEKIPRTSSWLLGDAGAIYLIHSIRFTESYSVTSTRLGGEQDITGPMDCTV